MAIQFGNQFINVSSNWTAFKENARQRGFSVQYNIDDGIYFIFGLDGPLAFNCVIWTGTVPDGVITGGYSQAQNDTDKTEWETDFKAKANQPLGQIKMPTVGVKSREFKRLVAASTTMFDDVVIPNGVTWRVLACDGHANYQGNTNVAVIWNRRGAPGTSDTLCLTYGDHAKQMSVDLRGDGVKEISVRLTNNSVNSVELIGSYEAVEL